MNRGPDYVSLVLLNLMAVCGGFAFAFVLHQVFRLMDVPAMVIGIGGMLALANWAWWDVEIKDKRYPARYEEDRCSQSSNNSHIVM